MLLSEIQSKTVLICLGTILLMRIGGIAFFPIMPQDAYYFFYSKHLDLSFFDHPPMIAYLIKFFTTLFGQSVWALRLTAFCTTTCTLITFYYLGRKFLSIARTITAFLLILSTFIITDTSLLAKPDVPLLLFWTLSLLCLYKAIFEERNQYWIWSGIMMGLAFDSKYTGIFLWTGLILFLVLKREYRKYLWSVHLLWCLFFFLITISPVIFWNMEHHFVSFLFQTGARFQSASQINFQPGYFFGVLAHQSVFLIPVLLFLISYFLFKTGRKLFRKQAHLSKTNVFLLCFFVPLFFGFLLISPFYWVKMNWMMPAYLSGIIWVSVYCNQTALRWQWMVSCVLHIVVAIEIIWNPVQVKSDDTWVGWNQLSIAVAQVKKDQHADFIFSADDYKTSAVLNFYLPDKIFGQNVLGMPALEFDYIGTNLSEYKDKTGVYIDSDIKLDHEKRTAELIEPLKIYFDSILVQPPIRLMKAGQVERQFSVFICKHYHPSPVRR